MVDVVLLQSLSYVAAAIGVCVAAFYYAVNLRIGCARDLVVLQLVIGP